MSDYYDNHGVNTHPLRGRLDVMLYTREDRMHDTGLLEPNLCEQISVF